MPALNLDFLNTLNNSYKEYPIFIETGTLYGKTMESLSPYFKKLYTIEVFEPNYKISKNNLSEYSNVEQFLGNSVTILPDLCNKIEEPTIFFLDGHWSSGHSSFEKEHVPLYNELKAIMIYMKTKCLIIIDDARLFGKIDGGIVDWSKINEKQILDTVSSRMSTYYYLPSTLNKKDRLILDINPI